LFFQHQNEESANTSLLDGLSNFVGHIKDFGPTKIHGFHQSLANAIREKANDLKLSNLIDNDIFRKAFYLNSTGVHKETDPNDFLEEVEISTPCEENVVYFHPGGSADLFLQCVSSI
jgi:hypothetical protein